MTLGQHNALTHPHIQHLHSRTQHYKLHNNCIYKFLMEPRRLTQIGKIPLMSCFLCIQPFLELCPWAAPAWDPCLLLTREVVRKSDELEKSLGCLCMLSEAFQHHGFLHQHAWIRCRVSGDTVCLNLNWYNETQIFHMYKIIFYFSFCKLNCPSTSKIWTKVFEIAHTHIKNIVVGKREGPAALQNETHCPHYRIMSAIKFLVQQICGWCQQNRIGLMQLRN